MRGIYLLIPLLLLLIVPASAVYNVSETNIPPNTGIFIESPQYSPNVIAEIDLNDMSVPSNTTFILTAGGMESYYIWLNLTRPYAGLTVRAEGAIQEPNGNLTTFNELRMIPAYWIWGTTNADVIIQWVFDKNNAGFQFFIVPSGGTVNWVSGDFIFYYTAYSTRYIGFTDVYIESNQEIGEYIGWFVTPDEWAKIEKSDITLPIGQKATAITSAIWDATLAIIEGIPVVGPVFAQTLDLIALLVSELVWLLDFIIVKNWQGTLILIEFLAISEALIYGQKRTNVQMMKRVAHNHVLMFTALVGIIIFLYEGIILKTIRALGSLMPG